MPDTISDPVRIVNEEDLATAIAAAISTAPSSLPAGAATGAAQASLLAELEKKADLTEAQPVGNLFYRSSDGTYQPARLDRSTNALEILPYEHHEIHDGSHFFVNGVQDLSINQVLDFVWVMPNTTKWTHWVWRIDTEAETEWYVYENAVATNPLANVVTPLNSNRNSLTASGTTMRYEVQANLTAANADTNLTGATLLKSGISGAGKTGGADGRENELVLKQGATYCLRVVATSAGYVDFDMEWYEHTDIA